MRTGCLLIVLFFMTKSSFSQRTLSTAQSQLNIGIGLSEYGTPVYVGMDFSLIKNISVGGEISFRSYNEYWGQNNYRRNITGLAANINYHFNNILLIPSPFDLYSGLNLGFYNWSSPDKGYNGNHSSGLGLGVQIGGRYYITKRLGANLEFGGGNAFSGGKVGFTLRF